MNSKTICVAPWNHLSVDGLGHFYNCCLGPATGALSRGENGEIIVASQPDAIIKHWKSAAMKDLRAGLLAGEKHKACGGCWRVEETNSQSYRAHLNMKYPVDDKTYSEMEPLPNFEYVDLRFGNLCNLACRMCIPYNTRKLFDEYAQMYGEESLDPYRKMDWFESQSFWDELKKYRHSFKQIHLAGGEPLIIKECWKFVRELAEEGLSKNITLSYNTNFTHITKEARELWPKFKGIDLFISMDGVGKVNEFIRYPQKWDGFEKNLLELDANYKAYNVNLCKIQPTVQAFNIHRIVEICEYVAQFKNISRIPIFNFLFEPDHFSPAVLPMAYREEAIAKISDYIWEVKANKNSLDDADRGVLLKSLVGVIGYIRTGDNPSLFHKFMRHNDIYDVSRNEKILEAIPELEAVYRK